MKAQFTICVAIASALAMCVPETRYTVSGEAADPALDNTTVYLYDYHTRARVDSTVVSGGRFCFEGSISGDSIRRIEIGRMRVNVILQPGDIVVDLEQGTASGTAMNAEMSKMGKAMDRAYTQYEAAYDSVWKLDTLSLAEKQTVSNDLHRALLAGLADIARPIIGKNDNSLGAWAMWNWASEMETADEFEEAMAGAGDYVRNYGPIARLTAKYEALKTTSAGCAMKDFTVIDGSLDGTSVSLSHYVGRGKYTLVDFWASWCGPCRREVPNIKAIYDEFHGDDFDVLSVAVWDDVAKTREAIEKMGMNWNHIVGASREVTDLYGIDGIPHIILFDPDGVVVARGLRGAEMDAVVRKSLMK